MGKTATERGGDWFSRTCDGRHRVWRSARHGWWWSAGHGSWRPSCLRWLSHLKCWLFGDCEIASFFHRFFIILTRMDL